MHVYVCACVCVLTSCTWRWVCVGVCLYGWVYLCVCVSMSVCVSCTWRAFGPSKGATGLDTQSRSPFGQLNARLGLAPSHPRSDTDGGWRAGGKGLDWAGHRSRMGRSGRGGSGALAPVSSPPSASQWHPIVFNLAYSVRLPPGDTRGGPAEGGPHQEMHAHMPHLRAQKRPSSHARRSRQADIRTDGRAGGQPETPRTAGSRG